MKIKRNVWIAAMTAGALLAGIHAAAADGTQEFSNDASGFVSLAEAVPDVILEIRYYSTYNFVGDRIDGYEEPCALLTKEAAEALKGAAADAQEQGYMLKIYDAYRPQMAVDNFIAWAEDISDTRMKEYFYPELDKSVLFDQGYIAEKSGHSRGSTLDLTLFDMETGKELDMGGTFDYFGELSHPDYVGNLTEEQIAHRNILRDIMVENGFKPLDTEWWHFTLENEPYPDTYFTFPVEEESVEAPEADVQQDAQQSIDQTGVQVDAPQTDAQQEMAQCPFCGEWFSTAEKEDGSLNDYRFHTQIEVENRHYTQCPICGDWFSTVESDGEPSEYMLHQIDEVEMSWVPESTENMVQCEFCGGWYEEGNVFRNHICPGRDEAYAPEE